MNKRYLKVALLALACVSMPVSFTSCDDDHDDINRLEKEDDAIKSQISALETALKQAQADATAAKEAAATAAQAAKDAAAKGDQALALAQQANAEAKAASEAAANAKAEAIQAALDAVNELKGSIASQETVDGLVSKIEAIETGLSTLNGTVDAQQTAIAQMQTQVNALNQYSELLKSLGGDNGKLAQIDAAIASINTEMGKLATQASVDAIQTTLDKLAEQVAEINGNLVTFITGRLTSVTLVPNLFVDGIETIEFLSLQYMPQQQTASGTGLQNVPGAKEILVSTKENPAQYRLNPTSTQLKDIDADNIEFVALQAESRGVVEAPIAYVKGSAEIAQSGLEKGILTVNASKTITGSLNLDNNQIYAVALKVPIAASHLQDKDVPEYVYSEYSRLIEATHTPKIAALPYTCKTAHSHYSDSATMWASKVSQDQLITKKVAYNQTLDLNTLVTGCLSDITKQITKEELAKYGMEFVFGIPANYTNGAANGTNQQEFIKFQDGSNSVVMSKTPAGLTNNKAAIDKEPIVRVMLVDVVNHKLVDQRYIKIMWTAVDVPPVDLGTKDFTANLGCGDISAAITWKEFVDNIYAVIKDGKLDMSKDQFTSVYLGTAPTITPSYTEAENANVVFDGNVDGDAAVIKWTLSPDEIGTIVSYNTAVTPHTWEVKNNVFSIKVTFTPNNPDYPVLTYTLKQTIGVTNAPAINGFYNNYWANAAHSQYDVYPVQYGSAAQTELANTTCIFHNNLMNGFTFFDYGTTRGRFIVKNLTSCGTWDMQFCQDNEQTGYKPNFTGAEPDKSKTANIGGYQLMNYTTEAANLEWSEGHTAWCGNGEHNETFVNLQKNAAGIGLLDKTAHMGIWATINDYNYIPVFDYNIKFIKPLTLKDAQMTENFIDGVVNGSKIVWTKAFVLTDCFGYLVAAETTGTEEKEMYAEDLYEYYEVQTPEWDTENILFGMKNQNGTVVVDPNATPETAMTAAQLKALTTGGSIPSLTVNGKDLVFTSNMGSQVGGAFNIWVKVTVKYGWGEDSAWVKIGVNPMQVD